MKRRDVLKFAVAAPFVGALAIPEIAKAETLTKPLGLNPMAVAEDFYIPGPKLTWMEMANRLWSNAEKYIAEYEAKHELQWDETEKKHMHAICFRMCNHLVGGYQGQETPSVDEFWQGDPSRHYHPDQDPDLLKTVRFEVTDGPIATRGPWASITHPKTYKMESKPCMVRRIRMRYNPHALDDLRAFHGIDAEVELVAAWGQQAALEIAMEIRNDFKNGHKIATYALYLPPFLSPVVLPPGDWSINRGFRIRYAKFV